jgi:hypothetical protein
VFSEDWALARLLDKVGTKMLTSARMLRLHPELIALLKGERPWESPDEAASELAKYDVARTRAEIELAAQAVAKLFEGKSRLSLILLALSEFKLSDRAAAFVDRMVQCFIWGLDTETTVMARAVLEAALEDTISEQQLASLGKKRSRHGYTYAQYRDAAEELSLLEPDRLHDLDAVRVAANEAVHATPGIHPPAILTLLRTILCLRALLPGTVT